MFAFLEGNELMAMKSRRKREIPECTRKRAAQSHISILVFVL